MNHNPSTNGWFFPAEQVPIQPASFRTRPFVSAFRQMPRHSVFPHHSRHCSRRIQNRRQFLLDFIDFLRSGGSPCNAPK